MRITHKTTIFIMFIVIILGLASCNQINNQYTSEQTAKEELTQITDEELSTTFRKYKPTLDGAFAEGYGYELYQAYKKSNSKQFIGALSKLDVNEIEGIIKLLVGEALNSINQKSDIEEMEKVFEDLNNDPKLSKKEKYAIYELKAKILYLKASLNIAE